MLFPSHSIQRWIHWSQCLLFSASRIKSGHCKASPPRKTSDELRGVNNTQGLCLKDSEEGSVVQRVGREGHLITR